MGGLRLIAIPIDLNQENPFEYHGFILIALPFWYATDPEWMDWEGFTE